MKAILIWRRVSVGLAVLLLLAGCDQGSEVEKGAKPEIILKGNHVMYNGTPLELGGELKDWVEVLGPYDRKPKEGIAILRWDSMGLKVWPKNHTVDTFGIVLNHRPSPKYRDPGPAPGEEGGPVKKTFSGYIEIGGVGIDRRTTVEDINKKIDYPYGFSCSRGMNACSALIGESKQLVGINVDGRKEKSLIYSIELSAKPRNKEAE